MDSKERLLLLERNAQLAERDAKLMWWNQMGLLLLAACLPLTLDLGQHSVTFAAAWLALTSLAGLLCQERKRGLLDVAQDFKLKAERIRRHFPKTNSSG